MNTLGIISLLLIVANVIFTYKGLTDPLFFYTWSLEVEKVLVFREYKRVISAGFLHVSWLHLIFNLIALYSFGGSLEPYLGGFSFLLIYFAGLIGGNLFALYVNRHHGQYSTVGASGAVCGILFSSVALFPGTSIGFFGLFALPAWLFGLIFIGFTIYGIKSRSGNMGHEAHLGGALAGMFTAILLEPSSLFVNYLPILAITVPCVIFIYLLVSRPGVLLIPRGDRKQRQAKILSIDQRYNLRKKEEQKEIDAILEKIHRKGPDSLSQSEKDKLDAYSRSK
ncbi:MAG: rhomboid family intramembrane serine protease [Puia sp.]|nr:rhomboid family intramembrane serine protease [Puia sp.]